MNGTPVARAVRARYADAAAETATPARLITMLYDRLARDLVETEAALDNHELEAANRALLHAQDIVVALADALEPTVWEGAQGLSDLYRFLLAELLNANVSKDGARVGACRRLVEPLRDAWHEAARSPSAW